MEWLYSAHDKDLLKRVRHEQKVQQQNEILANIKKKAIKKQVQNQQSQSIDWREDIKQDMIPPLQHTIQNNLILSDEALRAICSVASHICGNGNSSSSGNNNTIELTL